MAKSMSSLKRPIKFQPLLKEVPPLKSKQPIHDVWNNAFKVMVTHQSFSTVTKLYAKILNSRRRRSPVLVHLTRLLSIITTLGSEV